MRQDDKVVKYMTKFERSRDQAYTVITPSTPLAELEEFLKQNIFALGSCTCHWHVQIINFV